jgi:hypothetical protein
VSDSDEVEPVEPNSLREVVLPAPVPKPTLMDPREQRIGYILAGFAAAAAAGVALTGPHDVLLGAIGALATALLVVAVRHGQRVFTALAGFLVGIALSQLLPLELACVAYSGYLVMRTSNAQNKARRAQPVLTAAERRVAAQARAAAKASRKGRAAPGVAAVSKTPAPNRRYTPPKSKPTRRS